jgi:hypothetical protein
MKLHVTLLSAAIASAMFASPLWADDDKETATPTTTSAPTTGTRPTDDARPPEQRVRETEKDKDDAKAIPKTKPAAGGGGYVQTGKTIHYPGDAFSLRAVIPKSLKDVWDGKAVVNIVITMPGGGAISVPVPAKDPSTEGDKVREIVPLPAEVMKTLPAGDYQMAMVVTKIGGDPLNVGDWYGGFKGMLGVKRVKVAATTTPDAEDPNKTGEVTGDTDSDGYPDSDPNMPPPPPPTGGTGTTTPPPTGGTGTTTPPPTGGTGTTTPPPTGGTGTTTPPPTGGTGTTTPPATDTTAGKTAFDANCASCHGTPSRIAKASNAAAIQNAINNNTGGMGSLKSLTAQQLNDIAAYVATGG